MFAHYTELLLALRNEENPAEDGFVQLFCFNSWPAKGVPEVSIGHKIKAINNALITLV